MFSVQHCTVSQYTYMCTVLHQIHHVFEVHNFHGLCNFKYFTETIFADHGNPVSYEYTGKRYTKRKVVLNFCSFWPTHENFKNYVPQTHTQHTQHNTHTHAHTPWPPPMKSSVVETEWEQVGDCFSSPQELSSTETHLHIAAHRLWLVVEHSAWCGC